MKKRPFVILLLLLLGITVAAVFLRSQSKSAREEVKLSATSTQSAHAHSEEISRKDKASPTTNELTVDKMEFPAKGFEQREHDRDHRLDEWRTPIEFYGKIIDENETPVAEVQINFSCNDVSPRGTSFYRTQSDAKGLFSITQIQGKLLTVRISKEGYYSSKRDTDSFYYAGQDVNFKPDILNPVIFHLRKKGPVERLVTTSGRARVPLSGSPIELNLSSGQVVTSGGQVSIECVSDIAHKKPGKEFDWKLKLAVPGGGILQTEDEYNFEAPPEGYSQTQEISMNSTKADGWRGMIQKEFFLKFSDGNYGRLSISFIANNGIMRFSSYINPSGSRNLEYDAAAQPKPTMHE